MIKNLTNALFMQHEQFNLIHFLEGAGYKRNKLHQLKLFCAVIEEGTILKASKKNEHGAAKCEFAN